MDRAEMIEIIREIEANHAEETTNLEELSDEELSDHYNETIAKENLA